jgi:hypothetical protein
LPQRFGRAFLRIDENLLLVFQQDTLVEPETEVGLEAADTDDVFSFIRYNKARPT